MGTCFKLLAFGTDISVRYQLSIQLASTLTETTQIIHRLTASGKQICSKRLGMCSESEHCVARDVSALLEKAFMDICSSSQTVFWFASRFTLPRKGKCQNPAPVQCD